MNEAEKRESQLSQIGSLLTAIFLFQAGRPSWAWGIFWWAIFIEAVLLLSDAAGMLSKRKLRSDCHRIAKALKERECDCEECAECLEQDR